MKVDASIPSTHAAPAVVDLFCGAGGLTLGAHRAGFTTALAVDHDGDLTSSVATNFPAVRLVDADLADRPAEKITSLLPSGPVAGVIGGPPCQGFSEIGRRNGADPRNRLVCSFMEVVAEVRPMFFLMENVPALAWDRHSALLAEALDILPGRYEVLPPLSLNAADYGAATSRERLVLIGFDPSCVDRLGPESFLPLRHRQITVRDAISDLPEPTATDALTALPYRADVLPSSYARQMRKGPPEGLGSREARAERRRGRVSGVQATRHEPRVSKRFERLTQGERDPISRYPRLRWDEPSPVLRAGTGRDRGSFQAARPIHPASSRVISVREAARIQGFPDWFRFGATKWHSHRMIGNSVSPVFAHRVLAVIRKHLEPA